MVTVSSFIVWILRMVSKGELKSRMNGGHPAVSQDVERDRKGNRERRVQSFLWTTTTTTQAYISRLVAQTALTVDKAAIFLPIRDTVSNCHPLTESALPRNAGVKKLSCLEKAALIWRLFSGRRKGAIDWARSGYFLLSRDGCAVTLRYRVGWGH